MTPANLRPSCAPSTLAGVDKSDYTEQNTSTPQAVPSHPADTSSRRRQPAGGSRPTDLPAFPHTAPVSHSPADALARSHTGGGVAGVRCAPPTLSHSWHDEARELAATHTIREAAEELGLPVQKMRNWAYRVDVVFLPDTAAVPAPEPVVMDDDERLVLLADLMEAEHRTSRRRVWERLLREASSRPEPPRDVAAALAKLGAC